MSVRGEFVRIVGDAVDRLREVETERAEGLASDLERVRHDASEDLSAAAARALELWSDALPARLAGGSDSEGPLADVGERMTAISRIILGR
jgi:hypothetical protein